MHRHHHHHHHHNSHHHPHSGPHSHHHGHPPPPIHHHHPHPHHHHHHPPPVIHHHPHPPPLPHGHHHHVHPPPVIHVSVPTPPMVHHLDTVNHVPCTLADRPSVRVYCRARPDLSLTVRDGYVVLASSYPSDPYQQWVKDDKYSNRVRDDEGFPAFSLVNKATGQAIKHPLGPGHPVHLVHYNPDYLDESILWTESHDLGDTYKAIRTVNNICLNLDALHGGFLHGGVHDGTKVGVHEWNAAENQRWRITYYCKPLSFIFIPFIIIRQLYSLDFVLGD